MSILRVFTVGLQVINVGFSRSYIPRQCFEVDYLSPISHVLTVMTYTHEVAITDREHVSWHLAWLLVFTRLTEPFL